MSNIKNNKKLIIVSIAFGLIFSVLMELCNFNAHCNTIRGSVLRLHILANSDSEADQQLKLKVRDRLLVVTDRLFKECNGLSEAETAAKENLSLLKSEASKIIKSEGYNYSVDVSVKQTDFNTREYDGFTLPAGTYDAIRVVIGKGEGHNWWCVMFPPVCVPSASNSEIGDALNDGDTEIVENKTRYKCRFKVVEWYEDVKNYLKDNFKL